MEVENKLPSWTNKQTKTKNKTKTKNMATICQQLSYSSKFLNNLYHESKSIIIPTTQPAPTHPHKIRYWHMKFSQRNATYIQNTEMTKCEVRAWDVRPLHLMVSESEYGWIMKQLDYVIYNTKPLYFLKYDIKAL